jgi:hypothetical protein
MSMNCAAAASWMVEDAQQVHEVQDDHLDTFSINAQLHTARCCTPMTLSFTLSILTT